MDIETGLKHKFLESSNMSFQEVFDFAFKSYIPILQDLARELGEERVFEALQRAALESGRKAGQAEASQVACNDFAAFNASAKEPSYFAKHVLTLEIVEDTPQACEVKVSECLWAKTFREIGAAEIGYLLICHPDYAHCQGFNPRIRMVRTKTLMQGEDYCNHRFIWEA